MGSGSLSWRIKLILPLGLISVAWIQEIIDQLFFAGRFNLPVGTGTPVWSLLTAPFSHAGFGHLIGNTLLFLPLSYLVLSKGCRDYLAVWICTILLEIPVWLFWPRTSHGMSGVVYALMGYLFAIGFVEKRLLSIALTIIGIVIYGGYLPSLMPWNSPAGVSWIGHISGFLAGVLAALVIFREPVAKRH